MSSPIRLQEVRKNELDPSLSKGEQEFHILKESLKRLEKQIYYNHFYYDSLLIVGDTPDYMLKEYLSPFLTSRRKNLLAHDYERLIMDLVLFRSDVRPWYRGHCEGSIEKCDEVLKMIQAYHRSMEEKYNDKPLKGKQAFLVRTLETIHAKCQGILHSHGKVFEYFDDPSSVKTHEKEILELLRPFTKRVNMTKHAKALHAACANDGNSGCGFAGHITGCLTMSNFICEMLVGYQPMTNL